MTKRALILTWDGFQDQEVIYPYYRLKEAGFHVEVVSGNTSGFVTGLFGIKFESRINVAELEANMLLEYDLLVLPGGVKALEKLRQMKVALDFIAVWNQHNKVIASTCHGAQLLISAGVVKGREISGYYSIKDDINNAGGIYVDAPCVIDANIISSPHYKYMGEWMRGVLDICESVAIGH